MPGKLSWKVGGSNSHITWEQAERGDEAGFSFAQYFHRLAPQGRAGGVIDLPNVMSKFPLLGMSLGL
jgi:hypothetical protein